MGGYMFFFLIHTTIYVQALISVQAIEFVLLVNMYIKIWMWLQHDNI